MGDKILKYEDIVHFKARMLLEEVMVFGWRCHLRYGRSGTLNYKDKKASQICPSKPTAQKQGREMGNARIHY